LIKSAAWRLILQSVTYVLGYRSRPLVFGSRHQPLGSHWDESLPKQSCRDRRSIAGSFRPETNGPDAAILQRRTGKAGARYGEPSGVFR